ncbi:MAG: nucleotide exchange factor GrpE [Gammaproteobacteria bacterium]|nr:MAG: nucleotide exchange factor GrpE [Gammaproteobacteria bacterium]
MSVDEKQNVPQDEQQNAQPESEEVLKAEEEVAEDLEAAEEAADKVADEVGRLKEQLLRAHAEMQNLQRRTAIEIEKAHKFGIEKLIKELLPVLDSLEKAIEACGENEDPTVKALREGVEMTLSLMLNTLKKFNVEVVDPQGEPFDPQRHEAMSMVPNPEVEPNTVVAVMQKGYTLNDRLVRPAMVVVAKG